MNLSTLYHNYIYVLIIAAVMILSGYCSNYNILGKIYNKLTKIIKNKKWLLAIMSTIGGALPIKGRIIATAGMFDTLLGKDTHTKLRPKFGVLNYIATHHYYLWSPLEKTILIPMAVLGLSYRQMLGYTWPLLLVSLSVLLLYIIFGLKDINDNDFDLSTNNMDISRPKKITNPLKFIQWSTLAWVYGIIVLGNLAKTYSPQLIEWINAYGGSLAITSIMAFGVAWVLGSSGKFAGIVATLCAVYGVEYLTYFMAIEFAAYLVSPTHKCNVISCKYFNTPLKYYIGIVSIWAAAIILTGIITII